MELAYLETRIPVQHNDWGSFWFLGVWAWFSGW